MQPPIFPPAGYIQPAGCNAIPVHGPWLDVDDVLVADIYYDSDVPSVGQQFQYAGFEWQIVSVEDTPSTWPADANPFNSPDALPRVGAKTIRARRV